MPSLEEQLILKAKENLEANPQLKTKREIKDYLKAIYPVALAIFRGTHISIERRLARLEVCGTCELLSVAGGRPMCSICACTMGGSNALVSLVVFEETKHYGCHHPQGSRWKKNGV